MYHRIEVCVVRMEMRRIYLVRHGLPEKSTSEKEYIGVTDLPLSMRGRA